MLIYARENPPTRSNVTDPAISISSSSISDNKIESPATNMSEEMGMSTSGNRIKFHRMQPHNSSSIRARFSWMRNYVKSMKQIVERVAYMLSFRSDHSQPAVRSKVLQTPNHEFISRSISHDKDKDRTKKSNYGNSNPPLNSAIFQRDEGGPTMGSMPNKDGLETDLSFAVSKYLKTTDAKYIAAAPCESTRFWFPTVLRRLEMEGFRLVMYCIDINISEAEAQEIRSAFSGLSSLKFGGFITTNLDAFEDVIPRNLDVVISWFGIRSWGARKGLRFVRALQRSGAKRAVLTNMCANVEDEMHQLRTESDSRSTSFRASKVGGSRKRNLKDCSQMVVFSLNDSS